MKCCRIIFLFALLSLNSHGIDLIRIRGSDVLGAKLVPQLCELYRQTNPTVAFDVAAEGSTTAFSSLLNGGADVGMSNRGANETEATLFAQKGIPLDRYIAAIDCFAIIVNASNTVDRLNRTQIKAIFAGDVVNWSDVGGASGPISIFTRNASSASFADFRNLAMDGRDYAKTAIRVPGSEQPNEVVTANRLGITYVGFAYANQPETKIVMIDGRLPHERDYPYRRPCFYYCRGDARKTVREFVEWATRSREASEMRTSIGYLPPEK